MFREFETVSWGGQINTYFNCIVITYCVSYYFYFSESGIKMVDIGCGYGISTMILAEHFPKSKIYGLDLSEQGIKAAQAKGEVAGLTNATFICADVSNLTPDWTAEFDYAFTHMVIHDLPDPLRALKEIHRVLKPGGTLSVMDPKLESNLEDNFVHDHAIPFYAIGMMHCLPTSLRTGEGGGLGIGFGKEKTALLLQEAGYNVADITDGMKGSWHYICVKNVST